jgi:prophage tail gpP-like protein
MSDVVLKVDGRAYGGWKEVDISRSLEFAANTFALKITDVWNNMDVRRPIRMGAPCEVWIDRDRIITGYVDDVLASHDGGERTIEVAGRSKIADLIDCSSGGAIGQQFNNQNFASIARAVAKPFGIGVVDQAGPYQPARRREIEPAQRVFEFLEELAREEAVILTSDRAGDLLITRAGTERLRTRLELGANVLAAAARFSMRDRFSEYRVVGQRGNWDNDAAQAAAHVSGTSEDLQMRFRPNAILAEDQVQLVSARRRAQWQRNVAYGRSKQATYTVSGWRHDDGLWEPNRLVHVVDEWLGLDALWLLATVHYRLDERGERAELTVLPKQAFDLIPLPSADEREASWD